MSTPEENEPAAFHDVSEDTAKHFGEVPEDAETALTDEEIDAQVQAFSERIRDLSMVSAMGGEIGINTMSVLFAGPISDAAYEAIAVAVRDVLAEHDSETYLLSITSDYTAAMALLHRHHQARAESSDASEDI